MPLVEVQRNLRLLRQQVKADAEDDAPKNVIDAQISKATSRVVTAWDEKAVLAFANGLLSPLDETLKLAALDRADASYVALVERAKEEEKELGIGGLRQLAVAIEAVYAEKKGEHRDKIDIKGAIAAFEGAVAKKLAAEEMEASEKGKAASAIFSKVWAAAEQLFKDGAPVRPYGDGSIGDERARWAEFVFFRDHFVCPVCGRAKFKRPPGLKKPVCAHDKCETQFHFKATAQAEA
jgi:hypothetical protein